MNTASQNSFFRVVDAAANRASEGLRVVEDVVRMHLDDRFLATQLKKLRHDLAEQISSLTQIAIAARDSVGDVGRTIETGNEYDRTGSSGVDDASTFETLIVANFKRAQQAIRTLEEFAKTQPSLVAIDTTKSIEQIRYRCYTIEKACRIALRSSQVFPNPSVYVLVDGCDCNEFYDAGGHGLGEGSGESRLAQTVTALVEAGVDLIQLRDKTLSDRQVVAAGKLIAGIVRESKTQFIMNDRADLAIACGADGVHVGQEELTVAEVRRIIGPAKIVGVSTHSLQQVKQAVVDGADYIGVGPVFPSTTKSFENFVGLDLIKDVAAEIGLPAFAIGGIDLENAGKVAEAGCQRVAVTAVFSNSPIDQYTAVAKQLRGLLAD